jgi:hypothetical protein
MVDGKLRFLIIYSPENFYHEVISRKACVEGENQEEKTATIFLKIT